MLDDITSLYIQAYELESACVSVIYAFMVMQSHFYFFIVVFADKKCLAWNPFYWLGTNNGS